MLLTDVNDSEYRLAVTPTENPDVLEIQAVQGPHSITVDINVSDLREAIDAARASYV